MARPKKIIDQSLVEKLAMIHCTIEEIALVCECSRDTIERRFAAIISKAKAKGKTNLRRIQWEMCAKHNATMVIWLGKQILDQSDQVQQTVQGDVTLNLNIGHASSKPESNPT